MEEATSNGAPAADTFRRGSFSPDAPGLRAEAARLKQELETLADEFDRWCLALPGDEAGEAADLEAGARLHREIVARLARLEAVRAARA